MTKFPPLILIPGLLAAAFLSLLALANGVRLFESAPEVGAVLLAAAILWGAMFFAVHARSGHAVARVAVGGLSFYAAVGLAGVMGAPAFAENSAFFEALAVEGLVLAGAALAIAFIPYFWTDRERAS